MNRTAALKADANDPAGCEDEPEGLSPAAGFAEAFLARSAELRRIVAGMGFGPADADDILQDVYLEASRGAREYRGPDEAGRWLMRVTVNRCMLEYRRRRRFTRTAEQILEDLRRTAPAGPRPDEQAVRAEELEAIRRAMQDLDESLFVPLSLRYFSDLNATQIGEVLDLPASTVRSRLREARMILARILSGRGIEP